MAGAGKAKALTQRALSHPSEQSSPGTPPDAKGATGVGGQGLLWMVKCRGGDLPRRIPGAGGEARGGEESEVCLL